MGLAGDRRREQRCPAPQTRPRSEGCTHPGQMGPHQQAWWWCTTGLSSPNTFCSGCGGALSLQLLSSRGDHSSGPGVQVQVAWSSRATKCQRLEDSVCQNLPLAGVWEHFLALGSRGQSELCDKFHAAWADLAQNKHTKQTKASTLFTFIASAPSCNSWKTNEKNHK